MPDLVPPMQVAAGTGQAPVGPDWVVELAWTGHRCVAYVEPGGRTRLLSSGNVSMTPAYPELVPELERHSPPGGMILDGTLVARGEEHAPRVARLQRRSARFRPTERQIRTVPVDLQVADLLWLDGHSVVDLPYRDRRTLLEGLGFAAAPVWTTSPMPITELPSLLAHRGGQGRRGAARAASGIALPAGAALAAVGAGAGAAHRAGARRGVEPCRPAQAGPHREPARRGARRARAALRGSGRGEWRRAPSGRRAAQAPPGRLAVRGRCPAGRRPRRDLGRAAGGRPGRPHRVHGRRQAAAPALAGHRRRGIQCDPVGEAGRPTGRRGLPPDGGGGPGGWPPGRRRRPRSAGGTETATAPAGGDGTDRPPPVLRRPPTAPDRTASPPRSRWPIPAGRPPLAPCRRRVRSRGATVPQRECRGHVRRSGPGAPTDPTSHQETAVGTHPAARRGACGR